MSDYTPTTWTVRSAWASLAEDEQGVDFDLAAAEFDRWLAEVKAAAWFDGYNRGNLDGYFGTNDERKNSPYAEHDPYRTP